METAHQIIAQLGGRKFAAMTGATFMTDGDNTLVVKFKGSRKANIMNVSLNSLDLYDVKISKYAKMNINTVAEYSNVYGEDLREMFTAVTGLYTNL